MDAGVKLRVAVIVCESNVSGGERRTSCRLLWAFLQCFMCMHVPRCALAVLYGTRVHFCVAAFCTRALPFCPLHCVKLG